jgi:Ca2+-binding EF-hand superfamily protein
MHNEKYLKYVFQSFDKDRSGKISKKEFKEILEEAGVQQISGKLIDELVEAVDKDKDGEINYIEFLETMKLI